MLVNAVGAGGATGDVQKKSKRQMKKDRNDAKNGPGICNHYIKGHCTHEKCKYLHDVEAFLASKAPDIPGRCPFRNGEIPTSCAHHATRLRRIIGASRCTAFVGFSCSQGRGLPLRDCLPVGQQPRDTPTPVC